jgi:xanthine/CO dehydrogenase XdhC/CoxF family maturation factor
VPVLATLVRVLGSGFRPPGSRMLFVGDEDPIGDLSGGCLDGDVAARARGLLVRGEEARLLVYDGEQIADLAGGFGIGCPRRVEVLLQPVRTGHDFPAQQLLDLGHRRQGGWLGLVCSVEDEPGVAVGEYALFVDDQSLHAPAPFTREEMIASYEKSRPAALPSVATGAGRARLFVERIDPPLRLVLLGGTTLVEPLVRFARELGWDVVAFQSRADRSPPSAGLVIRHFEPARLREEISLDPRSFVVTMEHHQERDLAWLREVLPSDVPYVGVLGSRRRIGRMLDALAASDRGLGEQDRSRLYGPIGLDLGARTPAEIALAIVAEVQAIARGADMRPKREAQRPADSPRRTDP